MRPLLAFASDGSEKNINDAIKHIADQLNLTDDERHQLLPSGKQAIFANRVHWARTYLDKAGAIKRTRRSHFQITERGKQLLAENPTRIDVPVLKKFPEFIAFQTPKAIDDAGNNVAPLPAATEIPESAVTPEEAVQQAESQIFENLKGQLLIRIFESSPSFFEGLSGHIDAAIFGDQLFADIGPARLVRHVLLESGERLFAQGNTVHQE